MLFKKSEKMYLTVFLLYAFIFFYFNPRFFALLIGSENLYGKIILLIFLVLLNVFWFFAVYYAAHYIFSLSGKRKIKLKEGRDFEPYIGIFYATKNDFKEDALLTCVNQDYENYKVFILDDSDKPEYIDRIDKFARKYPERIEIIRRKNKKGFKAGNINNGLRIIDKKYEYIAIADSDSRFPKNFLRECIKYFPKNKNLAFVQAKQLSRPNQETQFARDLALVNDIHWKYIIPATNKYGFTVFYGHGALLKRKAIEEIGGFPEIVSEDLAVSILLRQKGYMGYTDENIVCYEDTPNSYLKYRKRHEKWVRGTAEFVKKYMRDFLTAKNISWVEKVDVLLLNLSLFLSVPFFLMLFIGAFAIPLFFSKKSALILSFLGIGQDTFIYKYFGMQERLSGFWYWDVFILLFITIFIHYFPAIIELRKRPMELLRFLKSSYMVSSGLTFVSVFGFIGGFISRKSIFSVTDDRNNEDSKNYNWIQNYVAEKKWLFYLEIFFGMILIVVFLLTLNMWILPLAFSLISSWFVYYFDWDNRFARVGVSFSFLTLVIALFIVSLLLFKDSFNYLGDTSSFFQSGGMW